MNKTVDILMITYNRPEYTKVTLKRLLDSCNENVRVWVWHNGNDKNTLNIVKYYSGHKNFYQFNHSAENKKLNIPTNWLWQNAKGDYIGKVDDDCIVPENWVEKLIKAHEDEPKFGVIGCWHFLQEDFNEEIAQKKIFTFNKGHQLMVNCWLGGSGYLMKRQCYDQIGPLRKKQSFTDYCIKICFRGYINGWYYPIILQSHLDDPRVEGSLLRTDSEVKNRTPLSAINNKKSTLSAWENHLIRRAKWLQEAPIDPALYLRKIKMISKMYYKILYSSKVKIWYDLNKKQI